MTAKEKLMAEIDDLLAKAFTEPKEEVQPVAEVTEQVTEEKVEKSFDEVSDAKAKGTDVSVDANGGGDVIKNKDQKDAEIEAINKTKETPAEEIDKAKDCKAEDKKDDKEEDDEDSEDMKKKKKMKKSVEISEEDFEILKKAKEAADPLMKSLSGLTDLVKSQTDTIKKLSDEVEAMKKSPAREPKSLVGYSAIEKSAESEKKGPSLMKSQVLETLFDMQKAGKVSSVHVCEYEATGNIQDPSIKADLQSALSTKFGKTE